MLKIFLLGTFQVLVDEQPMTGFVSNKVRALLAYLSTEAARPHAREVLTGLLWPDCPQSSAQGNLRYALSNLRKLLKFAGSDLLSVPRQNVQFNPSDQVWIDVAIFQQLLGNGRNGLPDLQSLEEAARLYRGEFLEGLTISDSIAFEEWRTVRREQFHRHLLDALHTLAETCIERGDYSQALPHAWRQLELEPWTEEAHQQVMRALALGGQRGAALAQYERCRYLLAQELDVEPSKETTRLFEDIRDSKLIKPNGGINVEKGTILTNVPIPLTSFVGRKREIAEIEKQISYCPDMVAKHAIRLLTLVGAGGCGKTRLAIESAWRLSMIDCFPNGVWWVDIARLSDPALVTQAVAMMFGLRETADIPLVTSLTNYLRNKRILLLLDNCEHLIDACAQLVEILLQSCPELHILATSREALDIDGEKTIQVNPLSLPDSENPQMLERLLNYEAVRLFVERAKTALTDFSLTDDNVLAVIQICRQLDGIPLAIELAARQLKVIPVEQIAAQLNNRFLLLTNGTRTALPHHRTLRAVLDWSYDYLSEKEQSLIHQLSVFSGGWTHEAAEQITTDRAFELIPALVNKSLVIVEQSEQAVRYRMLETTRQYAREKMAGTGQEESVRLRHLEFFLQFAECSEKELRGRDQKLSMQRVEVDLDNIRSALEWSLRSAKRPESGLRLVVAMSGFWNRRSYFREERQWLERALAVTGDAYTPQLRAWANVRLAFCAFWLGDFEASKLCLDYSGKVFGDLEYTEGIALVKLGRATLVGEQHDLTTARACLEESLGLLEFIGDKWDMTEALKALGRIYYLQNDLYKAKTFLNKAVQLCREISNTWQLGMTLCQLGFVALQERDYRSARLFFEESRQLAEECDDRDTNIDVLSGLGELARCEQNYQEAQTSYEEGLILASELGIKQSVAYLHRGLGYISLHFRDCKKASDFFGQSLQYWYRQNVHHPLAGCLAGLAGVAANLGEMSRSAQILGKVDAIIQETGPFRSSADQMQYELSVSTTRKHLGDEQYRVIHAEADDMTLEQVIQLALGN